MKKPQLFLITLGITSMYVSCPRTQDVKCTDTGIFAYLDGFPASDTTGSKIYGYKQNNSFDSLVDSAQKILYTYNGNKLMLCAPIIAGRDYKIMLPAAGKTFVITRVTNYNHSHELVKRMPYYCYNPAKSCYVNDSLYEFQVDTVNYHNRYATMILLK